MNIRFLTVIIACVVNFCQVINSQTVPSLVEQVSTSGESFPDTIRMHSLDEVHVTASFRPSTSRSSTPLQIMDEKEISRLGAQSISDVVRHFSGVTIKDYGGLGGLKTVSIRGLGAQHTGVSYDGVVVSDAQTGQVDIGRFSLGNLSLVSLETGLSDGIFHTARVSAAAGTLNLQAVRPDLVSKPYLLNTRIKAGSFGFFNPELQYAQRINDVFSASLFGSWQQTDGGYPFTLVNGKETIHAKRINSDLQSLNTEFNLYADLKKNRDLDIKVYYYDSERGLPGPVIFDNPYSGERLWDKNFFTQLRYKQIINPLWSWQLQAKYNYSFTRYLNVNNNFGDSANFRQDDRYTQQEYYTSGTVMYKPFNGVSISLAEDFIVNTLDNTIPDCPFPTRYTSLSALSAQFKNRRITVTGNVLGTYISERVEAGLAPADKTRLSPAISMSYQPIDATNLRVRASYKNIFRVPTFNDLYYARIGNRNLTPETTDQYNLGLTWCHSFNETFRYFSVSADGYYNRVHDKIVAIPTLFIWRMMNMGEVEIRGLDLNVASELGLHPQYQLLISGSYSYQKAIDITDATSKNYRDQIPYTPEHSGSGILTLENPWVNVTYSLIFNGIRYCLPQNIATNRLDGYVEQSISLNKLLRIRKCNWKIQAEIANLLDNNYEVIKDYPMPGRSYRLGVTVGF